MTNKAKSIMLFIIGVVIIVFILAFLINVKTNRFLDTQLPSAIEIQIEDTSSIENPSYDDIVALAKQGGMFERLVIFYNDSTIMGDKDPTPYSLVVEYDNDDTKTSISIRNKASFKILYDALFNILVIQRKIGK